MLTYRLQKGRKKNLNFLILVILNFLPGPSWSCNKKMGNAKHFAQILKRKKEFNF